MTARNLQGVVALAVLPAICFLVLSGVYYSSGYSLEDQEHAFSLLQSIATISALILGGVWSYLTFFRQRLSQPRINVHHEFETIHLDDGRWLIKVFACVENIGQVLVDLNVWRLRAERIIPLSEEVAQFISHRSSFTDFEAPWPTVAGLYDSVLKDKAFRMLLEPGETDRAVGNLILPPEARVVQIYSHFSPQQSFSGQGWQMQTVVVLPSNATRRVPDGEK